MVNRAESADATRSMKVVVMRAPRLFRERCQAKRPTASSRKLAKLAAHARAYARARRHRRRAETQRTQRAYAYARAKPPLSGERKGGEVGNRRGASSAILS